MTEHDSMMTRLYIQAAASKYEKPSAVYKPRIFMDGDVYCALYGDNIQDGCAGFGKTPADAMWAFDQKWEGIIK